MLAEYFDEIRGFMLAEYFDKIRGLYSSRVLCQDQGALCQQSTLTRSGGFMLAEYFDKIRGTLLAEYFDKILC